jgi:hypothetical protein
MRNFLFAFLFITLTISAFSQTKDDVPTILRKGVLTENQRRHAKIWANQEDWLKRFPPNEDVLIFVGEPFASGHFSGGKPGKEVDYVRFLGCESDAIVLGTIGSRVSQLTGGSPIVFSDLGISIGKVLMDRSKRSLAAQGKIVLTTTGGAVELDGRVIRVIVEHTNPLVVGGEYVLFLKYEPKAETFVLSSFRGIFRIQNGIVKASYFSDTNDFGKRDDVLSMISETVKNLSCGLPKK